MILSERRGTTQRDHHTRRLDMSQQDQSVTIADVDDYQTIERKVSVTFHQYKLFLKLHSCANLSLEILQQSLDPANNHDMVFKAGEGAGRSGSFFFFSHDNRFIIKTMTDSEMHLLLRILPAYVAHFENNPKSLLAKIFACFTIQSS